MKTTKTTTRTSLEHLPPGTPLRTRLAGLLLALAAGAQAATFTLPVEITTDVLSEAGRSFTLQPGERVTLILRTDRQTLNVTYSLP